MSQEVPDDGVNYDVVVRHVPIQEREHPALYKYRIEDGCQGFCDCTKQAECPWCVGKDQAANLRRLMERIYTKYTDGGMSEVYRVLETACCAHIRQLHVAHLSVISLGSAVHSDIDRAIRLAFQIQHFDAPVAPAQLLTRPSAVRVPMHRTIG